MCFWLCGQCVKQRWIDRCSGCSNMAVYISEREDRQTKVYEKSKTRSERKKRERNKNRMKNNKVKMMPLFCMMLMWRKIWSLLQIKFALLQTCHLFRTFFFFFQKPVNLQNLKMTSLLVLHKHVHIRRFCHFTWASLKLNSKFS